VRNLSRIVAKEGFLASLGMTNQAHFSAARSFVSGGHRLQPCRTRLLYILGARRQRISNQFAISLSFVILQQIDPNKGTIDAPNKSFARTLDYGCLRGSLSFRRRSEKENACAGRTGSAIL
jgi:hypothetical protein